MKYLKVFEAFFVLSNYHVTGTKKIWGYTKEEVEDFLLDFMDNYNLPISITFKAREQNGKYTTISKFDSFDDKGRLSCSDCGPLDDEDCVRCGNKGYINFTPSISIGIYTNQNILDNLIGDKFDVKNYNYSTTVEMYEYYKYKLGLFIDKITPIIENDLRRASLYKLEQVKIIDTLRIRIDKESDIGDLILEFILIKKQ